MGQELELKFRASAGDLERIRAAFPGAYETISMTTSYFDTPEGALSRLHWTLRHRQENQRHVCTLKTPGDQRGKGEWETHCRDILQAIPELAGMSGLTELEALTKDGVIRTCGARFVRQALLIPIDSGAAELALDSGFLLGGGRELPFWEAELELKAGSPEALFAFGREFAARFGLQIEPKSKFARARALGQED